MCGIHLIVQKNKDLVVGQGAILRMVESLRHRGPDGLAWKHLDWGEEQIWLGHNLLAISDSKENATQPMLDSSGDCGIIFNGQIYNHLELRALLTERQIAFTGQSDTETLLYWIKTFGRKGLPRLKGMFAFIFWDSTKQLLIIHRDSYGIKPLYYSRNRNYLAFSSEPAGLFASDLFHYSIDNQAICQYLKYKFITGNRSPWREIKLIHPGEIIEYWENKPLHFKISDETESVLGSNLKEALFSGFQEVIPKNMPVGLMFSGGIDSSIILKHCLDNKIDLTVFSIRISFGSKEDRADQEAVEYLSKLAGIHIEWIDITKADVQEMLLFAQKQSPLVADGAWFLSSKIAERAKQLGIKVLLSGAGADEWFAGYRRHWFLALWLRCQTLIPGSSLRNLAAKIGLIVVSKTADRTNQLQNIWDIAISSRLTSVLENVNPSTKRDSANVESIDDALSWDQKEYLVQDVLAITDMATMAHGIEGRFPFLHPTITAFASQFSGQERLKNGRKWMLKSLLEPFTGLKFVDRRKRGFGIPIHSILDSDEGREFISTCFSDPLMNAYFESEKWEKAKHNIISNPSKWSQEILSICWLRNWLKVNKSQD